MKERGRWGEEILPKRGSQGGGWTTGRGDTELQRAGGCSSPADRHSLWRWGLGPDQEGLCLSVTGRSMIRQVGSGLLGRGHRLFL